MLLPVEGVVHCHSAPHCHSGVPSRAMEVRLALGVYFDDFISSNTGEAVRLSTI